MIVITGSIVLVAVLDRVLVVVDQVLVVAEVEVGHVDII
jgi:hypothetical protein